MIKEQNDWLRILLLNLCVSESLWQIIRKELINLEPKQNLNH